MIENFNDMVDAFEGWLQPLAGTRNPGSYVNGRWVAGTGTPLSFTGVVQNATPEDLKVLDEGDRTEEAIKIHTQTQLVPMVKGTTTGDLISYNNGSWLVYNVADRKIGGYYKAIAIKQ